MLMICELRFQRFWLPVYASRDQTGFRWFFGTRDGIFCIRRTIEMCREAGIKTVFLGLDARKAFDRVVGASVSAIMVRFGIPQEMVNVLSWCRVGSSVEMHVGRETVRVPTATGVPQGRLISPTEFSLVMLAFEIVLARGWKPEWSPFAGPAASTAAAARGLAPSHRNVSAHTPAHTQFHMQQPLGSPVGRTASAHTLGAFEQKTFQEGGNVDISLYL